MKCHNTYDMIINITVHVATISTFCRFGQFLLLPISCIYVVLSHFKKSFLFRSVIIFHFVTLYD